MLNLIYNKSFFDLKSGKKHFLRKLTKKSLKIHKKKLLEFPSKNANVLGIQISYKP
jgi:hypothetical protein